MPLSVIAKIIFLFTAFIGMRKSVFRAGNKLFEFVVIFLVIHVKYEIEKVHIQNCIFESMLMTQII